MNETILHEANLRPASGGFDMWDYSEMCPVDYVHSISSFEEFMDREYDWQWTNDLDGKIYNQNVPEIGDGKVFKFRQGAGEYSYGIVWETPDSYLPTDENLAQWGVF